MKIRPIKNASGALRYQLDLGKIGKRRVQKTFRTKQEAQNALEKAKAKQKAEGSQGFALSEGDRIRFLEAKEKLATAGATIEEAVSFFLAHTKPEAGPLPVKELAIACVRAKRQENKRERYLSQLKCSALSFCKAGHEERPAHHITAADVEKWMQGNGWMPKTQAVYLTDLRTVFAWGISKGHLTRNPCDSIKPPKIEDKPVEIFDVPTCRKLLDAALQTDAEIGMLAYTAIGMFAGIRPEEELSWQHVHLEDRFIEVPAAIAKTRKRRIVAMSENLASWLEKSVCQLHGQVAPIRWLTKRRASLLKTAGIDYWPHDVLRHCFASYHLAEHASAEKTSLQLGHHNTQMLFQHYREIVRPRDATTFWELKPS